MNKQKILLCKNDLNKIWKTHFFKFNSDFGMIGSILDEVIKQPIVFYEANKTEKRHMTPWFNHIGYRSYKNPYIHDLYVFHELFHIATLPDYLIEDYDEWKEKMWNNELFASLTTEVFIYHYYPSLRENTFEKEIWFDILLEKFGYEDTINDTDYYLSKKISPVFEKITNLRTEIRNGRKPENEPEKWFQRYNNYNNWFIKWKDNFIDVQKIRLDFLEHKNLEKINSELKKFNINGIPFGNVLK